MKVLQKVIYINLVKRKQQQREVKMSIITN